MRNLPSPLTILLVAFLLFYLMKALFCLRTEEGWLTLENETLPEGCYYEKKGNSYRVKVKTCDILDGRIYLSCPDGNELIFYKAHGEFRTEKVIYEF